MKHQKGESASAVDDEELTKAALNTAIQRVYTKQVCQKRRRDLRVRNCRR